MRATLRPITRGDYGAVARLLTDVDPDTAPSAEELHQEHRRRPATLLHGGLIAEAGADAVGLAGYAQHPDHYRPDTVHLWGGVPPRHRNHGIGSALLHALEARLPNLDVRRLYTLISEADHATRDFLTARDFRVSWRRIPQRLDVQQTQLPDARALETRLAEHGLHVTTYADLAADPARHRKLFELHQQLEADAPYGEPATPLTFEAFLRERIEHQAVLHDALFIAVEGDAYVGMSSLWTHADGRYLETDFTGVLPTHRRRGIATLLKLEGLAYAKKHGYPQVRTTNDEPNTAMRALNDHLGFRPSPMQLRMEKRL